MQEKCSLPCPLCYANQRGREAHPGHRWYSAAGGRGREDYAVKYVSRPSKGAPASQLGAVVDTQLQARCPALWEYLTCDRWEDGKPRQVSTLLVFCEDGVWKACLNDRAAARSLWVVLDVPSGAWDAVERTLTGERPDWRPNRSQGRGK